jgi:hypothetical protein
MPELQVSCVALRAIYSIHNHCLVPFARRMQNEYLAAKNRTLRAKPSRQPLAPKNQLPACRR